jgi:hypothetical protein
MVNRVAGLLVAGVFGLLPAAGAQVTTEHAASIVVFPKVVVDVSRDTVIQLSNSANATIAAHCWYVDGALVAPELPPGPLNPPRWTITNFDLVLTQQQPTSWVASRGRPVDPLDEPCGNFPPAYDCYGAGFDPGPVPALTDGFAGELRCVETDLSGAPVSGNHLTGEATLENRATGDVSKYSALGFAGLEANDGDGELRLGEEYVGCPQSLLLDHTSDGTAVPSLAGSTTTTQLTVVPCRANLDTLDPESITVIFSISNEFEQQFSAVLNVQCWANFELGEVNQVFTATTLGTATAQTRMRPSAVSSGFLTLAEETRSAAGDGPPAASAAANIHIEGALTAVDSITLP